MTEQLLYKIDGLIDDFVAKTGDSPTHILVHLFDWLEMGKPPVYEKSASCFLDYLPIQIVGDYHVLELPMVVQLPQFPHTKTLFKYKKYKVVHEA